MGFFFDFIPRHYSGLTAWAGEPLLLPDDHSAHYSVADFACFCAESALRHHSLLSEVGPVAALLFKLAPFLLQARQQHCGRLAVDFARVRALLAAGHNTPLSAVQPVELTVMLQGIVDQALAANGLGACFHPT